jgi:predicted ATPase
MCPFLALNGPLIRIGNDRDALNFEAEIEEILFEIVDCIHENIHKYTWRFELSESRQFVQKRGKKLSKDWLPSVFSKGFCYLCAERVGPRVLYEIPDQDVVLLNPLGSRGEYTVDAIAKSGHKSILFKELTHPSAVSDSLKNQIEAWLSELCPGIRIHENHHPTMDIVNLEISSTAGTMVSNRLRPTNVGFGITYSLPIYVAILTAQKSSLILLENPEAHLHPKAQTSLARFLAKAAQAGIQIVIETHSDHILNGIRIAVNKGDLDSEKVKIHFFSSQINSLEPIMFSPQIDKYGRLSEWPNGFFDEWERSLETLME